MFARADYMNGKCTHSQFYAQFVTSSVKLAVKYHIGIESITSSKNEHFNNIPLAAWYSIEIKGIVNQAAIREAYSYSKGSFPWSKSMQVCILKEAARQIKQSVDKNNIVVL